MSRMLFWIVLFGAAWWFWRRAKTALLQAATQAAQAAQASQTGGGRPGGNAAGAAGRPALSEPMVSCAYCGAYSPRSGATIVGDEAFCDADHARRFARGERAPR